MVFRLRKLTFLLGFLSNASHIAPPNYFNSSYSVRRNQAADKHKSFRLPTSSLLLFGPRPRYHKTPSSRNISSVEKNKANGIKMGEFHPRRRSSYRPDRWRIKKNWYLYFLSFVYLYLLGYVRGKEGVLPSYLASFSRVIVLTTVTKGTPWKANHLEW